MSHANCIQRDFHDIWSRSLPHFWPMFPFYTTWNNKKSKSFLKFSGGVYNEDNGPRKVKIHRIGIIIFKILGRIKLLSLKCGFSGCGRGFGRCDGLGGLGGCDGIDGLDGLGGLDGFSEFSGFGGFDGFSGFNG